MKQLIPILGLNVLWFACVLGAANNIMWPAVLILGALLLWAFTHEEAKSYTAILVVFSLVCGTLFDGFLVFTGWVEYQQVWQQFSHLPPIWILMLWAGFGALVVPAMQWLVERPRVGLPLMAIGAPLSYVSAAKLGAITIQDHPAALLFIAVTWLLYFAAVIYGYNRQETQKHALA